MSADTTFQVGAADAGHVPQAPGVMPQYLQIQYNGVNLGGPDADTINFVGFLVQRGTGAAAQTITVSLG